jgi:hypothetical protein
MCPADREAQAGYSFHFNSRYCLNKACVGEEAFFKSLDKWDVAGYCEAFPVMLQARWTAGLRVTPRRSGFSTHNLIKNNQGRLAILDIEYAGWTSTKKLFRLDMLGVVRTDDEYKLIVFENKYGSGAIGGAAASPSPMPISRTSFQIRFPGLILLAFSHPYCPHQSGAGLLRGPLDLRPDMPVEILFLMAGFNMKSQVIEHEVRKMHPSIPAKIIFQDAGDTVIDYGRARELWG